MAQNDAEQRCMICRAIGFVIAAIVVGLVTWWLIGSVPAFLAIIVFLGLFAAGLWLVMTYCGTGTPAVAAQASAPAAGSVAEQSAAAPQPAPDAAEESEARREAEAAAAAQAQQEAEAEAARVAAEAKAMADAQTSAGRTTDATKAAGDAGPDYDGDGIAEGTDEGSKPATLQGARDGNPDDLKQIKGVGPKMENMLNGLGFFHFDQIASWSADEVAWVDANLEGFKGRVSRDEWVKQAGILATGGETEFSKRVEDGDVY